jgi:hypothetical protein
MIKFFYKSNFRTLDKIIIIAIISGAIFLVVPFLPVSHAALYDFYVDINSQEAVEDGSEQFPFKSIEAAMAAVRQGGLKNKKIYVNNGEYKESVALSNGVSLYGEDRDNTVIDGEGKKVGIEFIGTSSKIQNLTVKNANNDVIVDKKSKATIEKCSLKDAAVTGVEIKKSSTNKRYQFTMIDSAVSGSRSYGLYVSRRRIHIENVYIHNNDEEGLDLHDGIRGTVKGSRFENNKESGIELIVAATNLNIHGNTIKDNDKQGIGVQVYSSKKGRVNISRNEITGNGKYGIKYVRFAKSLRKSFENFIKANVKLSKNTIKNNDDGDFNYEFSN